MDNLQRVTTSNVSVALGLSCGRLLYRSTWRSPARSLRPHGRHWAEPPPAAILEANPRGTNYRHPMEYALSSIVTLFVVVILLRRRIKRAVNHLVAGPQRACDDELQMIIAREKARMRAEVEAASSRVGEAKIQKRIGGRGRFAFVRLRCRAIGAGITIVDVLPTAAGDYERSEGWADGAFAGARLGLELAKTTADCEITLVSGQPVDSFPTVFAIAGMRAVWRAIRFQPSAGLEIRLESALLHSGQMTIADLESDLRQDPPAGN